MSRFVWLDGLDADLREHVLFSLRVVWTQASNALEGNTFSEGDTLFFLKEGLTVSGKTLQEHLDIQGHSDAVKSLAEMAVGDKPLDEQDIFSLHRLVQTESVNDVYRPVGAWKREDNGTEIEEDGKIVWHEYPSYLQTPKLMEKWLSLFTALSPKTREEALLCYAKAHLSFVSIHPFFDGNGRMARLLANFPLLRNGFPPIIIPRSERQAYLRFCYAFQKASESPFPTDTDCAGFAAFLEKQWVETWKIIEAARQTQANRKTTK
ncbi:MAG: Fic family protein [Desulfovibrio sp.]|nr:Fic family protein [Desulfovibrio sp.]